ncbi:MAG: dehydrogenase, partial [Pseudomonadota bacterium]
MRILYDPAPRTTDEMFSLAAHEAFLQRYNVTEVTEDRRDAMYQAHLPEVDVLISQQPMGRDRLVLATKLRAIFNVETNFLPNIDYDLCFERGIHVLTPGSVFAVPVAEIGLGMALSLARGIHTAHADFVAGREAYGLESNTKAEILTGS